MILPTIAAIIANVLDLGPARGLPRSTLYDIDHAVEMDPTNADLAFLLSRLTKKGPST